MMQFGAIIIALVLAAGVLCLAAGCLLVLAITFLGLLRLCGWIMDCVEELR